MSTKTYPVDYRKGDDVRQAKNRRDETNLKFAGYRPVTETALPVADDVKDPSYADLRARAKILRDQGHDVKAGGVSYDELLATVSNAQADQDELDELATLENEGGFAR